MAKKKRFKYASPKWQIIGLALLAVVTLGVVVYALKPPAVVASAPPAVQPLATKTATPVPKAAFIGDSYTAGTHNAVTWPEIVAASEKWAPSNVAVGGSGYANAAGNTFLAQVPAIKVVPDVIIVAGSRNDTFTPDKVAPAAAALFAELKKVAPKAKIVVIGPIWDSTAPMPGVYAANEALRGAAADAGLAFVDALAENWLSSPSLVQGDQVHPNDAGQKVIAQRVGQKLKELGL